MIVWWNEIHVREMVFGHNGAKEPTDFQCFKTKDDTINIESIYTKQWHRPQQNNIYIIYNCTGPVRYWELLSTSLQPMIISFCFIHISTNSTSNCSGSPKHLALSQLDLTVAFCIWLVAIFNKKKKGMMFNTDSLLWGLWSKALYRLLKMQAMIKYCLQS